MSGLLIGSAVIGAGAGLGSYYLNKPKKQDLNLGTLPFKSLKEINTGQTMNDIIMSALTKGTNIGYGPDYTSRVTNPAVAQREARFKEIEMPSLSSELSGRGMGRSSIAGNAINLATGQKERDINSYIADAYAQNEAQKKVDQARYEGLGMDWTSKEAAQQGGFSDAERSAREFQIKAEAGFNAAENANINAAIGTGMGTALEGAAGFPNIASSLAPKIGGSEKSSAADWSTILNAITRSENTKNIGPFTKRIPSTTYA